MNSSFLEAGKIINTHGINGEVKIDPWADSPQFLLQFKSFWIDNHNYDVLSSRVHKKFVIASLRGINSIEDAECLKEKIIYISRDDAKLEEGQYFLTDLLDFTAIDEANEHVIGKVSDIMTLPGGEVLVINGEQEHLVPLRKEFVVARDMENKIIKLHLIEGM